MIVQQLQYDRQDHMAGAEAEHHGHTASQDPGGDVARWGRMRH